MLGTFTTAACRTGPRGEAAPRATRAKRPNGLDNRAVSTFFSSTRESALRRGEGPPHISRLPQPTRPLAHDHTRALHAHRSASLTHSRPPLRLKIRGHTSDTASDAGSALPIRGSRLSRLHQRGTSGWAGENMGTYRALRGRQLSQPTVKPTVERPPVELVPRRDALSL